MNEAQIRLQRDALSTPWGFRLQGGKDFKTPLTVQRVFVGSPADGELHRGDIILGINSYDASHVIHKQAQDLIKNSGGTLNLIIKRAGAGAAPVRSVGPVSPQYGGAPSRFTDSSPYRSTGLDSFNPKPAPALGAYVTDATRHGHGPTQPPQHQGFVPNQFGTDYTQHRSISAPPRQRAPAQPGSMLNKVQNSLAASTGYGGDLYGQENGQDDYDRVPVNQLKQVFNSPPMPSQLEEEEPDEPRRSVRELKSNFNSLGAQHQKKPVRSRPRPASHSPGIRPPWQKPTSGDTNPPADPGWTAGASRQQAAPAHRVVQAPRAPPPSQVAPNFVRQPQQNYQPEHMNMGRPAWTGSLKSSGGPKPWEMREAAQIADGGASGIPPVQQEPVNVHQPRVQNVNYGPGGDPTYSQQGDHAASDSAQVAHLQYNTPIGLYSKHNASEALKGQTQGRPGEGTMQVSAVTSNKKEFNPAQSEVLRALQEEENFHAKPRGHGLHPQQQQQQQQQQQAPQPAQNSPRYQPAQNSPHYQQPQHHVDPQQSPMMHLLENQMADQEGTSDF